MGERPWGKEGSQREKVLTGANDKDRDKGKDGRGGMEGHPMDKVFEGVDNVSTEEQVVKDQHAGNHQEKGQYLFLPRLCFAVLDEFLQKTLEFLSQVLEELSRLCRTCRVGQMRGIRPFQIDLSTLFPERCPAMVGGCILFQVSWRRFQILGRKVVRGRLLPVHDDRVTTGYLVVLPTTLVSSDTMPQSGNGLDHESLEESTW